MHTSLSHGASLSPKRPKQDRTNSGVSPAVWEWLAHAYLVLPGGVPIPEAAQVGPRGLRCMRRCFGSGWPTDTSFSHGASLSPTRPRRNRGDSGASVAALECLAHANLILTCGVPIPQAV